MKALADAELRQIGLLRADVEGRLSALLPDARQTSVRLHEAMRYALLSPGKRIRPILAVLCAEHLGCERGVVLSPACALEFVHAASLVLDDLPCMDDADTRRGQPSVHARFGEEIAVLTGVALLNEAYAILARAPHVPALARQRMFELLAETIGPSGLVGGQEHDLRRDQPQSLEDLSDIHHRKTAVLFMASVEMAGLTAQAGAEVMDALRRFAQELGLAFQALDDLQDADDLAADRPQTNVLSVLGPEGARARARARVDRAKSALADAGLQGLAPYVDRLLGAPVQAA